jgi:DNA primase
MIPPQTVQAILDTARIEEVVGEFVFLKKRGVNLLGLCPFHNEKTPSFNVNPAKNIFKCFGCGEGGDAISFLMKHSQLSYPDALRWLAKKYSIEIEEQAPSEEYRQELEEQDILYLANEFAQKYYHEQMMTTDYGRSVGLGYFKHRGLLEATIERFGLGYAPPQGGLIKAAQDKGFSIETLQKAGLVNSNGYEFVKDRVIFPIYNPTGKVVGFGGRILTNDKKQPKYLNTAETLIYNKSKLLYGIYQARTAIRKQDECLLTEGYLDVLSLAQAGIENVVASSGTALTEEQILLIKRQTNKLTILYDGDAAGIKAAFRGAELALVQNLHLRVALIPEGHDPDSYIQKTGTTAFQNFIKTEAKDFLRFKTAILLHETKNDPIKRSELVHELANTIALIDDPIQRDIYVSECSKQLGVSEEAIVSVLKKIKTTKLAKSIPNEDNIETTPQNDSSENIKIRKINLGGNQQEKAIIAGLLRFGNKCFAGSDLSIAEFIISSIIDVSIYFESVIYETIFQEYEEAIQKKQILTEAYFIQHKEENIRKTVIDILSEKDKFHYSPNWLKKYDVYLRQKHPDENYELEVVDYVLFFKLVKGKAIEDYILMRLKQERQAVYEEWDFETMKSFLKQQEHYKNYQLDIAKKLGGILTYRNK